MRVGRHHTAEQTPYGWADVIQGGRHHTDWKTCHSVEFSVRSFSVQSFYIQEVNLCRYTDIIMVRKHHIFEQTKCYFVSYFSPVHSTVPFWAISFRFVSSKWLFAKHEILLNGLFFRKITKFLSHPVREHFAKQNFAGYPTARIRRVHVSKTVNIRRVLRVRAGQDRTGQHMLL